MKNHYKRLLIDFEKEIQKLRKTFKDVEGNFDRPYDKLPPLQPTEFTSQYGFSTKLPPLKSTVHAAASKEQLKAHEKCSVLISAYNILNKASSEDPLECSTSLDPNEQTRLIAEEQEARIAQESEQAEQIEKCAAYLEKNEKIFSSDDSEDESSDEESSSKRFLRKLRFMSTKPSLIDKMQTKLQAVKNTFINAGKEGLNP